MRASLERTFLRIKTSLTALRTRPGSGLSYAGRPILDYTNYTLARAVADWLDTKWMIHQLNAGFYRDRLIFMCAYPRAGSSVLANIVSTIQSHPNAPTRGYGSYMERNQSSTLLMHIGKDFPQGGVLKYHMKPSNTNLYVSDYYGCKRIVLFRNPIDQIAAEFCASRRAGRQTGELMFSHIQPYYIDYSSPTAFIEKIVESGYVAHMLMFICDWARYADERTLFLRYEDFMNRRREVYDQIFHFLRDDDINKEELYRECDRLASQGSPSKSALDAHYKKGWTDGAASEKYFSTEEIDRLRGEIHKFAEFYPNGKKVYEFYPELQGTMRP